jgi:hypothetical protein
MTTESQSTMSVWETPEALEKYVYSAAHAELIRQRPDWFERFVGVYLALWRVPVGHIPGIDEAKKRLAHLERQGPIQFAFTFKTIIQPDEQFQAIDWSSFQPCPALSLGISMHSDARPNDHCSRVCLRIPELSQPPWG